MLRGALKTQVGAEKRNEGGVSGASICEVGEADGGGCMNTTLMLVSSTNSRGGEVGTHHALRAEEEKINVQRGKKIIKSNKKL